MFNIQPGQGLGFPGSKEIALGLGTIGYVVIVIEARRGKRKFPDRYIMNRNIRDDQEIIDIIAIIIQTGILDE